MSPSKLLVKGVLAFFSSTIDDFTIMLVFVSRAQREFQDFKQGSFKVMTGQIIGFSLVIFVSVTASMFGLLVPEEYMDLIGFFPLVIGIYKYWELCFHSGNSISDSKRIIGNKSFGKMGESTSKVLYTELMEDDIDFSYEEACNSSSTKAIRSYHNPSLVLLPEKKYEYQDLLQVMNSSELGSGDSGVEIFDDEDDEIDDDETFLLAYEEKKKRSVFLTGVKNMVDVCLDPFVLEVTAFSLMCASDNVAIYISLFIGMSIWEVLMTALLFYLLLLSSIASACLLIQMTGMANYCDVYSRYLVPTLLVPLGLNILSDSVAWPL